MADQVEATLTPPFKKGDWVGEPSSWGKPAFGKVKECYPDDLEPGKFLIDLCYYNPNGEKVGRISPPLEGPTTYEPCISASRFFKIEEPDFPLKVASYTRYYSLRFIFDTPVLPEMDDELIRQVEMTATDGASIHAVNTEVGIYRNSIFGVTRLIGIMKEKGPTPEDTQELQKRIDSATEYHQRLQKRVTAARLAKVSDLKP